MIGKLYCRCSRIGLGINKMKPKNPLIGKRYHVASTDDKFLVTSVTGETVICKYTNKDRPDVTTNITALGKVVKLGVWEEV